MNAEPGTPSAIPNLQQGIETAERLKELAIEYVVKYGFQVLGAIIILAIGMKISQWVGNLFIRFGQKKKLDVTLTHFIANVIRCILMIFVALMAIEKLGVTIDPLIASVGAMIFGASFAIQAPLSNYAAGLMVILTRPFVVGNTISVKGVTGIVEEVRMPNTVLSNGDGDRITIPNKEIVGEIVYNSAEYKIVARTVGVS